MTVNTTWTNPAGPTLDLTTDDIVTEAIWDAVMSNLKRLGGANGLLYQNDAGLTMINDSANSAMTCGLTVNQGAADDEILSLKSSDVTHGFTAITEADTYVSLKKFVAASGGALLMAYQAAAARAALQVCGEVESNVTTKDGSAEANIMLIGSKRSGTGNAANTADGNLVAVCDHTSTRFILDADGDSHQDVGTAWTNMDNEDDAQVLEALALYVSRPDDPIKRVFGNFLEVNKHRLEELRLVTFNDDGHHFVNMSRLTMLLVGAVRQTAGQVRQLQDEVATIKQLLLGNGGALPELP